jgi:hypothetical protein
VLTDPGTRLLKPAGQISISDNKPTNRTASEAIATPANTTIKCITHGIADSRR